MESSETESSDSVEEQFVSDGVSLSSISKAAYMISSSVEKTVVPISDRMFSRKPSRYIFTNVCLSCLSTRPPARNIVLYSLTEDSPLFISPTAGQVDRISNHWEH